MESARGDADAAQGLGEILHVGDLDVDDSALAFDVARDQQAHSPARGDRTQRVSLPPRWGCRCWRASFSQGLAPLAGDYRPYRADLRLLQAQWLLEHGLAGDDGSVDAGLWDVGQIAGHDVAVDDDEVG